MTKQEAIALFGALMQDLAKYLERTNSAISQWGEVLTKDQCALVLGYSALNGVRVPKLLRMKCQDYYR